MAIVRFFRGLLKLVLFLLIYWLVILGPISLIQMLFGVDIMMTEGAYSYRLPYPFPIETCGPYPTMSCNTFLPGFFGSIFLFAVTSLIFVKYMVCNDKINLVKSALFAFFISLGALLAIIPLSLIYVVLFT
jgi:hypothetical protein